MENAVIGSQKSFRPSERLSVFLPLSAASGFCGAYGVFFCGHIFACGQTGNLLALWNAAAEGNILDLLLRVLMLFLFMLGITATVLLPEKLQRTFIGKWVSWQQSALVIEFLCVLAVMLIPASFHSLLQVAPIFLASALQYNSFKDCEGVTASTIFCSNNIRQLTLSFWGWKKEREESEHHRFKIYGLVILAYSLGILFCCLTMDMWGRMAFLPVLAVYLLLAVYLRKDRDR